MCRLAFFLISIKFKAQKHKEVICLKNDFDVSVKFYINDKQDTIHVLSDNCFTNCSIDSKRLKIPLIRDSRLIIIGPKYVDKLKTYFIQDLKFKEIKCSKD